MTVMHMCENECVFVFVFVYSITTGALEERGGVDHVVCEREANRNCCVGGGL